MGKCKDCKHWGQEAHHQFHDLRECVLINEKAIPSVIELGTVLLESGDYASTDAKLWVDRMHGCALFEPGLHGFIIEELQPDEAPVAWKGKSQLAIIGATSPTFSLPPIELTDIQPLTVIGVPSAEVAGYLKDGTPVFYGRDP